jgi:hypothetical protein
MKIKITCTDGKYQAGLIYDVPDKKARELIAVDKAFEITEETINVSTLSDEFPVYIEGAKDKKVKHGNRTNNT